MRTDVASTSPSAESLKLLSNEFDGKSPQDILSYALEKYFPGIILGCSFGAEDVVLVDMMHHINSRFSLFYLDTDFLFPETHQVRDRIIEKYGLQTEQIHQVKSPLTPEEQAQQHGAALWLRDPNLCCSLRKVEPLGHFLKGYSAWITGIRRDQAPSRSQAGIVEWDTTFHRVKFNPLATWTSDQVWNYIRTHNVPYNPLHDQHYPSIGCTHCTAPVMPGEDPRSGRWQNTAKLECGLHR